MCLLVVLGSQGNVVQLPSFSRTVDFESNMFRKFCGNWTNILLAFSTLRYHGENPLAVYNWPSTILPDRLGFFSYIQQKRSGCPDLPPPPPSVFVNSSGDDDDPSYATVKDLRPSASSNSPRVQLLRTSEMRASDGQISRFGTRKYQNVLRVETQTNAVSIAPVGWG